MSIRTVPKIEAQIQEYFKSQRKDALAKSTKQMYLGVVRSKLIPFCKMVGIEQLDETFQDHIDDYIHFIRNYGISAHTTSEYLTVTKQFFTFHGIRLEYTFRIPRAEKQAWDLKQERRWFSERDVALCRTYIFRVFNTRNHLLVRIFSETGARINEVANIKFHDINFNTKTLLLRHSKTVPRSVKLSEETIIYFERHIDSFPAGKQHQDLYLFPRKNQIYKIVMEMLRDLNLKRHGDGRGPHTFRHYVATDLRYGKRLDLDFVSRMLGDTSEMVTTRYIHPTPEMLHRLSMGM